VNSEYQIIPHTKAQLRELYGQPEFWRASWLPFTRLRLKQYLENPLAAEEDVLWLNALHQGRIVAYLGLLPDLVLDGDRLVKIAWPTSWWADPKHRGKGIAALLFDRALELYPYSCVNSATPWARRLLLKRGLYKPYATRPRSFWFLNLNPHTFRDFGIDNRLFRLLQPCGHALLGRIGKARLQAWLKGLPTRQVKLEYVSEPDPESMEMIRELARSELSHKSPEVLAWRMNNLLYSPLLKGIPRRHDTYFGNTGEEILSYQVKLWSEEELVGFLNLLVVDKVLRIPYFYLKEGFEAEFAALVGRICLHNCIDVVYSQHPRVNAILKQYRLPHFHLKSYPMEVLVSPALDFLPSGRTVQDGDGAF